MGLDVTHDAFSGAYSAFNRFRQVVAKAAGCSYPNHTEDFVSGDETIPLAELDQGRYYTPSGFNKTNPGLTAFFVSNDCEGTFSPKVCKQMADEMEAVLHGIDAQGSDWGHIERDGGFGAVARKYITGCRLAHSLKEKMVYH